MAAPRPSYDQALKRLLTQAHDGFLALIKPDAVWRDELSPELPDTPRQADLIWEVDIGGETRRPAHRVADQGRSRYR